MEEEQEKASMITPEDVSKLQELKEVEQILALLKEAHQIQKHINQKGNIDVSITDIILLRIQDQLLDMRE